MMRFRQLIVILATLLLQQRLLRCYHWHAILLALEESLCISEWDHSRSASAQMHAKATA